MKVLVRVFFLVLAITANLISCKSGDSSQSVAFEVKHAGALRNFMHKGDLSSHIALGELTNEEHLYALGALEGLKGEVLVLDGQPYLATERDGELVLDRDLSRGASLLVYSSISAWQSFKSNRGIIDLADLQDYLEQIAPLKEISLDQPFPFLVKGTVGSLRWHVINWPEEDTVHTHEKHLTSGLNGSLEEEEVTILGFYSNSHRGIFTHHSTNLHMHVLSSDQEVVGHVDELSLQPGFQVSFPEQ